MLLDEIMPTYHFNVVHSAVIHAAPGRIFRAIKETRAADIPLFNTLFWMRELPGRLTGRGKRYFTKDENLFEQGVNSLGFIMLAEETEREIVFGAIAQWWRLWGAKFYQIADRKEFLDFDRPGYARAVGNFYADPDNGTGRTKVRHETRIYAPDPSARKKFAVYWWIIYPGAALIRRMWLKSIKRRAEKAEALTPPPKTHQIR